MYQKRDLSGFYLLENFHRWRKKDGLNDETDNYY